MQYLRSTIRPASPAGVRHKGFAATIWHHCPPPVAPDAGWLARPHVMRPAGPVWYRAVTAPPWAPAADTIDDKDRKKLEYIHARFRDADKDNNGRIDKAELRSLLESHSDEERVSDHLLHHWLSEGEVERVMAMYDLDHSGDLSLEEFQNLVADGILLDNKLSDYKAAFDAADVDDSGALSADELRGLLEVLGFKHTMDNVVAIMQKYDLNENGKLEFNEFMCMMRDNMLDVSAILSYVGARSGESQTTKQVIEAMAHHYFHLIMSEEDLEAALAHHPEQLLVLFAGTTWCSSCRAMVQPFKELAGTYPSALFLMLWGNVNDATKTLFRDRLKVRSTPGFFLFRKGDLLYSLAGGNAGRLEAEIRRRLLPEEKPTDALYAIAEAFYQ
eukprot:jgi/Chrzof1/6284/Cz18g00050.t1